MNRIAWMAVTAAVLSTAGTAWWWWGHTEGRDTTPAAAVEPVQPLAMTEPAPPDEPAIRHPIEPPAQTQPGVSATPQAQAEAGADPGERLIASLTGLLGQAAVLQWLQPDAFINRVVATVDNLPRSHAAAQRWPVVPTPGRFAVTYRDGFTWAAPDNERRYDGLVQTLTALDPARAAILYRGLYPQFQQAYEELGFPNRYFNDRLVDVIDHLLAAPEAPLPLALTLTEVRGEVSSTTPWLRYEYADDALETRSAGQRMMMRVGPGHQRMLMTWLRDFRAQVAR